MCIGTNNVSLGIVNGQISIICHGVMALVNVKKWFLACSSLSLWSIIMKLHKNDRSNKRCILAQKFCHLRLSVLAHGAIYMYKIMKKNLCKIRVQTSPAETYSKCSK